MPSSRVAARAISIPLLSLSMAMAASAQDNSINPALLARAKAGKADAEIYVGFHYMQGKGVP